MIRAKTITEINSLIDQHKNFSVTDFKIESKGNNLSVEYEYDKSYFFKVEVPTAKTSKVLKKKETRLVTGFETEHEYEVYQFTGNVSPGEVSLKESLFFEGKQELRRKFITWLDCLWEELVSLPINREIQKQNEIINSFKEKFTEFPDSYFSKEEGEDLKKKLDELENTLISKLESEVKNKEELSKSVKELHQEISSLKETIFSIKKGNWFKAAFSKTFSWISKEENRKFLGDGTKLLRHMLPENLKDIIN